MNVLVTWAVVLVVITVAVSGPTVLRTVRARERRTPPVGETSPRRRDGVALHARALVDHERTDWFGPAGRAASREATPLEQYPLSITSTTRRTAA